ncbi:hypothetical protein ACI2JM_10125 [Psychrobacter sp. NPDC064578]|uniref:hypothetical protein n=1 Tax=Psychrobacter sp. NPDC064578 TaxID=3364493 RepID=UPI00384E699B
MKTEVEYEKNITYINKLICEKYWSRESDKRSGFIYTCKEIGREFGFKHQDIPSTVKGNAHLVVLDCQCIVCGKTKICHTRSQLIQLSIDSWRCDECWDTLQEKREREYLEYRLQQKRLKEEQRQSAVNYIKDYKNSQSTEVPSITTLNEVDRFLLAATIESLGAESLETTISLRDNLSLPLSPFFRLDQKILHHLFKLNLLLLTPEESYEYISVNEEQELEIDYYQATFEFAYNTNDLTEIMVDAKARKNINSLVVNTQFEMWCQQIQLGECLSYLITRSKLNNLAPPIGEKLVSLLRACLAECSVSVMHYIIYKAVESAAAYVQKPNITRKHASNSISGNIERIFGKISSGSWHRNKSFRDVSHPQSAMAKVFFDYVFGIEDCGFHYTLDELFKPYTLQQAIEQVDYSTLGSMQSTNYSITINDLK